MCSSDLTTAPLIIVIGENVRLREQMDWLGVFGGRLIESEREKLARIA